VDRGYDGASTCTEAEPRRPEPEDRSNQEGFRNPVGPVRVVLPHQSVADRGVEENRENSDYANDRVVPGPGR
jgi:hypothetical protein